LFILFSIYNVKINYVFAMLVSSETLVRCLFKRQLDWSCGRKSRRNVTNRRKKETER